MDHVVQGVAAHAQPAAASPLPPGEPAPTLPSERIEVIDVVRGVALFGILAANIRGFAGPFAAYFAPHLFWTAPVDRVAQALIDTFVQGKFITIFAVLFGAGFAAQLTRAEDRGSKFGWVYARRLLVLCLLGVGHGLLIWAGDILLAYGAIGFLLLFFRSAKERTLWKWATIGVVFPFALAAVTLVLMTAAGAKPPSPAVTPARVQKSVEIFAHGSWSEIQQERARDVMRLNWGRLPMTFMYILGLFLFGVLAWRRRFFQPSPESLPRYRTAMIWSLGVGSALSLAATLIRWFIPIDPGPPTAAALVVSGLQMFGTPALSLGYVSAIVVLYHKARWRMRFRPFGAVGRTALTNYLLQSVVGTLIFYSYGLGLFGRFGPAWLLVPTALIFAAEVWISGWWLERFRFGPAEAVWRWLTYGKLPVSAGTPAPVAR